jgi:hypothetical protein
VRATLGDVFRRAAAPLSWYYAIAVAVPVLNGAALDGAFLEHAAFVVAVPAAIVTLAGGGTYLFGRRTQPTRPPRAR